MMEKRNFVVPTEIVRGYEHIRDTLGEEKAGRFLESVIVYGAYGEKKIDPPELRQAIKLAWVIIDKYNLSKKEYQKKYYKK